MKASFESYLRAEIEANWDALWHYAYWEGDKLIYGCHGVTGLLSVPKLATPAMTARALMDQAFIALIREKDALLRDIMEAERELIDVQAKLKALEG
jgi:hypothetical protein